MTKMKWYVKVTDAGGKPCNGGKGKYSLPFASVFGEWSPSRKPVLCESGWHVTDLRNLNLWGERDCRIFVVIVRGGKTGSLSKDGKLAFESVRFLFEIDKWMVNDAVRKSLPGMGIAQKNRLVADLLDYHEHHSYFIISEYPKVARELEKIIEKRLKRIEPLL